MIFKTVEVDATNATHAITLFGKQIKVFNDTGFSPTGLLGKAIAAKGEEIKKDMAILQKIEDSFKKGEAKEKNGRTDILISNASDSAKKKYNDVQNLTGITEAYAKTNQLASNSMIKSNLAASALNIALVAIASIAIPMVIKGISNLIHANDIAIDKARQITEEYKNSTTEINNNISNLEGMSEEFYELSRGVDENGKNIGLSADQYSRYREIVSQIADISPSLVKGYNDEGLALLDNNNVISEAIALQQQLNKEKTAEYLSKSEDVVKEVRATTNKVRNELSQIGKTFAITADNSVMTSDFTGLNDVLGEFGVNEKLLETGQIDAFRKIVESREQIISAVQREYDLSERQVGVLEKQISSMEIQLKQIDTAADNVADFLSLWASVEGDSWYSNINTDYLDEFKQAVAEIAKDTTLSDLEMKDAVEELGNAFLEIQSNIPTKGIEELNQEFDKGLLSEEDYNQELLKFIESIERLAASLAKANPELGDMVMLIANGLRDSVKDVPSEFDLLTQAIDSLNEDMKSLPSTMAKVEEIQNKVNEGYHFSYEEINEIKDKYAELIPYITRTSEGWQIQKGAVDTLSTGVRFTKNEIDLLKESHSDIADHVQEVNGSFYLEKEALDIVGKSALQLKTDALNAQIEMTKTALANTKSRISGYSAEVSAIKSLSDAYRVISKVDEMGVLSYDSYQSYISDMEYLGRQELQNALSEEKFYEFREELRQIEAVGRAYDELARIQSEIDELGSGKISGGSPSKTKKEVEEFKVEIDQFEEAVARLEAVRRKIDENEKEYDNTLDNEKRGKLLRERILLLKEEEKQSRALLEARTNLIEKNVDTLSGLGFEIDYNSETQELYIKNMEHINTLTAGNTEKTNDYRKSIQDLISNTEDLSESNINLLSTLTDVGYSMRETGQTVYEDMLEDREEYIRKCNLYNNWGADSEVKVWMGVKETLKMLLNQQLIDQEYYAKQAEAIDEKLYTALRQSQEDALAQYKSYMQERQEENDAVSSAVVDVVDEHIAQLEKEKEALQKINEEEERQLELAKLLEALENAKNQRNKRVYYEDKGWVWEADQEAIDEAQENLDAFEREEQINAIDEEINKWQEYRDKITTMSGEHEKVQNKIIADSILGKNWENSIFQDRNANLGRNVGEYVGFLKIMRDNVFETANALLLLDELDKDLGFATNGDKSYLENIDYSLLIKEAVEQGNYAAASIFERIRNEKIDGMGLDEDKTYNYYSPNMKQSGALSYYDANSAKIKNSGGSFNTNATANIAENFNEKMKQPIANAINSLSNSKVGTNIETALQNCKINIQSAASTFTDLLQDIATKSRNR